MNFASALAWRERSLRFGFIQKRRHDLARLLAMVNGLLDLEKIRAGMLELNREVNSLLAIINRSIDAANTLAEQSRVQLVNEASDCELFCDGDRLVQVMLQLIMDAIERSAPAGKVVIAAREVDSSEVDVTVTAQADGDGSKRTGTAPSLAVSWSGLERAGDTGLGLAICAGIVSAHKGTLSVQTDEKTGNLVFRFKIPLPDE